MTLEQFFQKHSKAAIALSGGVDSVYLMNMAKKYGADVQAYFAKTEFQPDFELDDAERAAKEANVRLCVINFSALEDERIVKNDSERCYFCKRGIMQIIKAMAMSDGYDIVCDGTNASDDSGTRPGCRALEELSILSPLRICGIEKSDVRRMAREEGISVWDKPAYACLATRIKTDEEITREKLATVETTENFLRTLGLSDFRVRTHRGAAKLELCACDMDALMINRHKIVSELKKYYSAVSLDLEGRDEKLPY